MPKKSKTTPRKSKTSPKSKAKARSGASVIQALRGGKALPKDVVLECLTTISQERNSQLEKRSKTQRQMATHFGKAKGLAKHDASDAKAGRAQEALLRTHDKLAKKTIAAPKAVGGFSGSQLGQIRVTVTPPFDYDIILPGTLLGNQAATQEGSSDRRTGKMSVSAVSASERGFNGGSMYTTVGAYFHPPARGTLTIQAAPKYSFQWWTNSLQSADAVNAFGVLGLEVYGIDVASLAVGEIAPRGPSDASDYLRWDESQTDQIGFDCGFDVQAPVLSAEVNVDPSFVYLMFVVANVAAHGVGWPGSVAGSKLSVTVPSLTYDFQREQVFSL